MHSDTKSIKKVVMNIKSENKNSMYAIFVGGLANSVTNQDLYNYFAPFGRIAKCEVQTWRNNPLKCRGFATVDAYDEETFNKILSCSHKLGGRVIECKRMIIDKTELDNHSKDQLQRKVFVSGLSKKVDDEQFRAFFSQYGQISMAYVVKHHKDKKSKGFGFICFDNKSDRDALLEQPEILMDGKRIVCSEYSTKMELKKGVNNEELLSDAHDLSFQELTIEHSNSNTSKRTIGSKVTQVESGKVSSPAQSLEQNYRFNRQTRAVAPPKYLVSYFRPENFSYGCSPSSSCTTRFAL